MCMEKASIAPMENMSRNWTRSGGRWGRARCNSATNIRRLESISLCQRVKIRMFQPQHEGRTHHAVHDLLDGQRASADAGLGLAEQPQPLRVRFAKPAQKGFDIEFFLGAEMIRGRAQVYAGLGGQRPHSHAIITVPSEQPLGGVQQPDDRLAPA